VTYSNVGDTIPLTRENLEAAFLAMRNAGKRTSFRLNARALLDAGASDVLMIDPSVYGTVLSLAPEEKTSTRAASTGGRVAAIRIDGPLAQQARSDLCAYVDGYDAIAARFSAALSDVDVDSIVVIVNSPGGDAAGVEEATRRMADARDRSGKPVLVYIDETAASAAYWIAAGVASPGHIYMPAAGRAGSIGAISAVVDETEALKKEGIAVQLIREPEGKAEGHPAQPLTELAMARSRERVKELASRFYAHVAQARGLDAKDVRALDAAMFTGAEAKRRGLIDGVQSLESVVALAADLGRKARSEKEQVRMEKAEQERLQAFEKSALESTGAKTSIEHLGKVEGMKVELETLRTFKAKADTEAKTREAEQKVKDEADLVKLVDAAVADGRLKPASRESFLTKARAHGGKVFAQAALEDREVEPVVASAPIVGAKVPTVEAFDKALAERCGLTEADYANAKKDGVI